MERIVVGVDGSEGANAALRWAAREAAMRGAVLEVVAAYINPWRPGEPSDEITAMDPVFQEPRMEAERVLEQARAQLEPMDLTVETTAVDDAPGRALVRRSADADLLVVGTRGRGGFAGLLLGSVSQQAAHHAACPVVVVPSGRR
jgi:nucleotide-binding universal stress UspA family protein